MKIFKYYYNYTLFLVVFCKFLFYFLFLLLFFLKNHPAPSSLQGRAWHSSPLGQAWPSLHSFSCGPKTNFHTPKKSPISKQIVGLFFTVLPHMFSLFRFQYSHDFYYFLVPLLIFVYMLLFFSIFIFLTFFTCFGKVVSWGVFLALFQRLSVSCYCDFLRKQG